MATVRNNLGRRECGGLLSRHPELVETSPKGEEIIEPKFNKEDVWAVAEAIEANWRSIMDEDCIFCGVNSYWNASSDTVVHKKHCIVLVARDLLTGRPAP